jgi:hypothetical protein
MTPKLKTRFSHWKNVSKRWKTIIIEKWRKLNEAKKNLTGFQLGNDGLSSTITLKDAAGREFKTSHNLVVTTVLDTLQQVLDEKIIEVEAQIDFAG